MTPSLLRRRTARATACTLTPESAQVNTCCELAGTSVARKRGLCMHCERAEVSVGICGTGQEGRTSLDGSDPYRAMALTPGMMELRSCLEMVNR